MESRIRIFGPRSRLSSPRSEPTNWRSDEKPGFWCDWFSGNFLYSYNRNLRGAQIPVSSEIGVESRFQERSNDAFLAKLPQLAAFGLLRLREQLFNEK